MRALRRGSQFAKEVDMYPPLLRRFSRLSISVAEVPFFGKRIDLVFASRSLLSLYAIETKLADWRSAFKQAALNQLAAQRSYVAVPEPLAQRLLEKERDLFLKYDVGLIAVNEAARILVRPKRNGCFSRRHYRALKNSLSKGTSRRPQRIGVVADAISSRSKALVFLQAGSD